MFPIRRCALFKAFGLGAVVGSVGGCDAIGTPSAPPKPGKFQTVVRATDTTGQQKIAEIVRPQPACASGYHTIISEVESIG